MPKQPKATEPAGPKPSAGVPLIDVQRQFQMLHEELLAAVGRVCASGRYILGPDCQQLEVSLASYCGVEHAVGCASGSDAVLLALMACGVEAGDEVIVPSYTFFATAAAVSRLGAVPVFVDIEPAGYTIDPQAVAAAITPATRAIIPVHLFGQCAAMDELNKLAQAHGLKVIEDAAQAIGAELDGRRAGGLGDVACFSFYPTKNLGAFGDAGLLTTGERALADKLRLLRAHGMQPRYHHQLLGINSRLDTLQAAVLNVKLPHLDRWSLLREQHARRYGELFAAGELDQVLGLPASLPRRKHVWNQYLVRVPDGRRDALREHLTRQQIGSEIYYPIPLHQQPCFAYLGKPPVLSETERAAQETLALPIFPEMTAEEQEQVVRSIAEFFGHRVTPRRSAMGRPKFLSRPTSAELPQELRNDNSRE